MNSFRIIRISSAKFGKWYSRGRTIKTRFLIKNCEIFNML